ncbi:MAG: dihydrodipicolinate synthase family protein [Blautia sp.]|nr:dihydrodipicolinate synthase family protein [Blautia sp.]
MLKQEKLEGIIPATITPFHEDESLNTKALSQLLEWNLGQGAKAFFIGGSSAECFLLTPHERKEIFETAAAFKEQAFMIAHVGAISVREAEDYARCASRLGYDAVAATPPFYYGFNSREIYSYYEAIAQAAGKPVWIYNFPGNTGKQFVLEDPFTQKLFQSSFIQGVKHTNSVLAQLERIRHLNQNLIMMNGYDETLVAALALGADGAIGSSFNFTFPLFDRIYRLYLSGDREEALKLQVQANQILYTLYEVGLIPGIKYILNRMGIAAGISRRPFHELSEDQKRLLDECMAQMDDR